MPRIALYTIGMLKGAPGDPVVQEFFDRTPSVFDRAALSDGFIARSGFEIDPTGPPSWGETALPASISPEPGEFPVFTLSLWRDLESVNAFAYFGAHGDAFQRRNAWMSHHGAPSHVAWWVEDDHTPTWAEGAEHMDRLIAEGPSIQAFDLGHPFAGDGTPGSIDRAVVRQKIEKNAG